MYETSTKFGRDVCVKSEPGEATLVSKRMNIRWFYVLDLQVLAPHDRIGNDAVPLIDPALNQNAAHTHSLPQ